MRARRSRVMVRDIRHVMPMRDKYRHTCSDGCLCKPRSVIYLGVVVVVHNSFDHREFLEDCVGRVS